MPTLRAVAALALAAAFVSCGGERPPADEKTAGQGTFGYQRETPPDEPEPEPLLALSYEGGLIKDPDPTPFVRVYPDGLVRVHYPAYMKKAGDYEMRLSDEEIEALLADFADQRVLTVGPQALREMAVAAREQEGLVEPDDDHGVATVVEIHADEFTPAGEEAPTLVDVDRRIVAQELPRDAEAAAERFPALAGITRGVRRLEALAESPELAPAASQPPASPGEEEPR